MKKRFSILFVFIVCIIGIMAAACSNAGNDKENKPDREDLDVPESSCISNDEIISKETKTVQDTDVLERFGIYLEKLYTEGRKAELDSHVISTRLNIEEAALLAEKSPLLEHIRYYAEDQLTIVTGGICILTADINGDGIDDVIEYGPDENGYENGYSANMLNIYLGTEDGGVFCPILNFYLIRGLNGQIQ